MAEHITPGEAFVIGNIEIRIRARLRRVFQEIVVVAGAEVSMDFAEVQLGVGTVGGPASYPGAFPVVRVALKEVLLPGRGESAIVI